MNDIQYSVAAPYKIFNKICFSFCHHSECIQRYATEEALLSQEDQTSDSESSLSQFSEDEAQDMEL